MRYAIALLAVAGLAGQPGPFVTARAQEATFKSAVDLIAVDVQVVDGAGKPLSRLGPENFEVAVNGQKRRVQWAVFTRYDATAMTVESLPTRTLVGVPRPSLLPVFSAETGRTIIIAVDTASFRGLDARPAMIAA